MRIRYACDTPQHNDYVAGIRALPRRGDIELPAGARAELGYRVAPMDDADRLTMAEGFTGPATAAPANSTAAAPAGLVMATLAATRHATREDLIGCDPVHCRPSKMT